MRPLALFPFLFWTVPALAAEPPADLRRAAAQLLTALQKQDEKAIVALLEAPEVFSKGGVLTAEARAHLFDRPQPYARSIGELAKDWGIQFQVRMLGSGGAVAVFHTWGTKVEQLRDEDYRVSYFICRFRPTGAGWKLQRLC
ncbi:MAG: hypothetical protein AB7E79_12890 [Rhodospirillaceae bacterium]